MRNFFVPEHLSGGIKGCPNCKQTFHLNNVNVLHSDGDKGNFLVHTECLSCGSKQLTLYSFMIPHGADEGRHMPIESVETMITELTKDEVVPKLARKDSISDDDAIIFHQFLETGKHDFLFAKT